MAGARYIPVAFASAANISATFDLQPGEHIIAIEGDPTWVTGDGDIGFMVNRNGDLTTMQPVIDSVLAINAAAPFSFRIKGGVAGNVLVATIQGVKNPLVPVSQNQIFYGWSVGKYALSALTAGVDTLLVGGVTGIRTIQVLVMSGW